MIHINKNNLIYGIILFGLLFFLLEPEIFTYTIFHNVIKYIQDLILIIMFAFYLKVKNKNLFTISIIAFYVWLLIATFINHGEYSNVIYSMIPTIALILVLDVFLEKNGRITLLCVAIYCNTIVYLNTFLFLIKPEGLVQALSPTNQRERSIYFLGVSNQIGPFIILSILSVGLYCYLYKKKRIFLWLAVAHGLISFVFFTSTTTLLGVGVYLLLLILLHRKNYDFIKFTSVFYFLEISAIQILVVGFQVQKYFTYIIYNILHKDITFSTRTEIWEVAIEKIKTSLWIGFGGIESGRYIVMGTWKFNAHNIFLQILLFGGIVAIVLFMFLVFKSIRSIYLCESKSVKYFVFPSVFVLCLMELAEVYPYILNFLILYLIFYCRKIKDEV